MAYSKAKLKSSGDKASPCFRPFWMGKLSHKCLPLQTSLHVSISSTVFAQLLRNSGSTAYYWMTVHLYAL
jgi:hypothetical protein